MKNLTKDWNNLHSAGAQSNRDVMTDDIRKVRSRLLNKGLLYYAIITPFALIFSLARIPEHGWHPIYLFHIILSFLIIAGAIFKKRLSYSVRAFFLIGILLTIGVGGLLSFGLVGGGPLALAIFAIMTALVFGTRAGLIACIINLCLIIVTGAAVSMGIITFSFSINEYATSITAWVPISVFFFLFVPVTVIALGVVYEHLNSSLRNLRKSEEKFRILFKSIPVPTFTWKRDEDDFVLFNYNKIAKEFTDGKIVDKIGVKASEMYGDDTQILNDFEQCFQQKTTIEREMKYQLRTTGKHTYLHVKYGFVPPDLIMVHIEDISERYKLNEKLQESEEKFRALTNQTTEGITVADMEGNYIYVNPAFCKMSGYTKEELLRMTVFDMKAKNQSHSSFYESKDTMEGVPILVNLQRKDKTEYLTEIIGKVITISNEKLVLGTIRDITNRIKAEDALKENERNLIEAQKIAKLGHYSFDIKSGYWTNSVELDNIFGIDEEYKKDIAGCVQILHPECLETMTNYLQEHVLKQHQIFDKEFKIINLKTKQEKWVHGFGNLKYDDNNNPIEIFGTIQDITERKQAEKEKFSMEAQLRQSQKLSSIGTLASGIAHEINNPLMSIINYAEIINDDCEDEELQEFSKRIQNEGNRIATIVKNLLSFSRQNKQEYAPVRLYDTFDTTLSLIATMLRKDHIEVITNIPEDLPEIICRSQQIQQVILNLLTNARDALNKRYASHDDNKIIQVNAKTFEKEEDEWIRFTIKDHGIGIPVEIIDKLFDPFFTTQNRAESTGLGLSISHGIISEHGGKITVESKVGEYTCFHVDLKVKSVQ